jgi:hypothetical protein
MNYFEILQVQLGIPMWLIVVMIIWTIVWKLLALWKSARKNHIVWFIVLAIVNTVGILEILYIYILSEAKPEKKKQLTKKKKTSKRK